MKTDTQIQNDVTDELKWNPMVTAIHIGTTVKDGIVTLSGNVPHYTEKNAAEEAVQRVSGVRAVANELEVQLIESYERSDEDIAEAALNALKWNYQVPEGVKVSVSKGWVTLKGTVQWDFERTAAKNAVRHLMGVTGVFDEIKLKSQAQPEDVKTRIEAALKRSAETEGKGISVEVDGTRVTLRGQVHSLAEKEDARFAAWCTPGVTTVENELRVAA
jgi:osmotically-inducible protein OsmY